MNEEKEVEKPREDPLPSVLIEPLTPQAWIAGSESGIAYKALVAAADWTPYLVTYEDQTRPGFDAVSCVCYSGENCIELQLQRMIDEGEIPAITMQFLSDNKYLDTNGKVNFSDRFSAILSGTTPNGNYMTNAPDSFRKDGLIPEWMLPFPEDIAKEKPYSPNAIQHYLNPECITPEMRALGKKFLEHFTVMYEVVWYGNSSPLNLDIVRYHLKQAPLHFAAGLCAGEYGTEVIKGCGCGASHARTIIAANQADAFLKIFDSFGQSIKKLAVDYCIPYVYKIVLTTKKLPTTINPFTYTFTLNLVPESVRAAEPGEHPENDGNEVIALQRTLQVLIDTVTKRPYMDPKIIPVANFGPITTAAVIRFQQDRRAASPAEIAVAKGQVGPKTRAALNAALLSK